MFVGGMRPNSHWARADGNLSKYNVRTHQKSNREQNTLVFQKEINPTFVGLISFWNLATSTSPGHFHPRCFGLGNSHSREPCTLLAIPDAPPACIRHRRRQAAVSQAARGWKPKQVQCTHSHEYRPGALATSQLHKGKHPTSVGCFPLWNPATSYSPGRFRSRCFAHWACASENLAKYNVRTHLMTGRKKQFPEGKEISPATRLSLFLWNPATSYSPGRFHPRCFAHWARVNGNLSKYNVRTHMNTGRKR